jgi:hypothetical protein
MEVSLTSWPEGALVIWLEQEEVSAGGLALLRPTQDDFLVSFISLCGKVSLEYVTLFYDVFSL